MLPITDQIAQGRLVSPRTRRPLHVEGDWLVDDDGERFPFLGGVPRLLSDAVRQEEYRREAEGRMVAEYTASRARGRLLQRLDAFLSAGGDHRGAAAIAAFEAVARRGEGGGLCLSIGGGPMRIDPRLVNLNLDAFQNVDVVADAYALPYADGGVDAIHCEAVLEHLELPEAAVREMFRVLPSGGEVFASTPFLQAFHAYPNHFQNFTLEGHNRLFIRQGFEVISSGACVGPTFALTDLAIRYLREVLPGGRLGRALAKLAGVGARFVRPLDRRLLRRPQAHFLASTVYAHLVKP